MQSRVVWHLADSGTLAVVKSSSERSFTTKNLSCSCLLGHLVYLCSRSWSSSWYSLLVEFGSLWKMSTSQRSSEEVEFVKLFVRLISRKWVVDGQTWIKLHRGYYNSRDKKNV